MGKKLIGQAMCAILIGAASICNAAYDSAQDPDVIGGLIQQIQQEKAAKANAEVANVQTTLRIPSQTSAKADTLSTTYHQMARCLVRAALVTRRDMFRQPRKNIEEFLRGALTQASFETGRFSSRLATHACNYWGMKDRMDVGADKIAYKNEDYERFPNMYEGCLGYMKAICRERYAGFEQRISNKEDFLRHISRSGWCPDGDYVQQAMSVYEADQEKIDRAVKLATDEIYTPSK